MNFGDLQFYDIVIFAGIAVFIIFRLRKVLGKRTGFEKSTNNKQKIQNTIVKKSKKEIDMPDLDKNVIELKKAYEVIDNFNHKEFLEGSRRAFETIINAFNQGDKKTLKNLLTDEVFKVFNQAINNKNIDPESQIFSLNIKTVEKVIIGDEKITIKIKFISEMFKNNDESTISKNEDTWSFQKSIKSAKI